MPLTAARRSVRAGRPSGHLYRPAESAPRGGHPALVVVHPGGGVKEQAAGLYSSKLAEQGYVTLAFDASHQGDSGGEPHFLGRGRRARSARRWHVRHHV